LGPGRLVLLTPDLAVARIRGGHREIAVSGKDSIMARPTRLLVAGALSVVAAGLSLVPASAGTEHVVVTASSPSTGQPIAGGGSWLVNKPSGYYVGRAIAGSRFDNTFTSTAGWHYGRAGSPNMCAWAMPGSLGTITGQPADSCSAATRDNLAHRRNIGKDFNALAHDATDGTVVAAGACPLYYNYFVGTNFAGGANGGHWNHLAGSTASTVRYRFTTLDNGAAVVRDTALGWGFAPASCVGRPTTVFNDND
jgi:hypothetical protein